MRRAWDGWKRAARAFGDFQARVLLTLLYFTVVAPFAVLVRVAADPLALKPGTPRGWRPRGRTSGAEAERAWRQS